MVDHPQPGINDDVTDDTPFEALTDNTLRSAGYGYLIGDAALSTARLMEGDRIGAAGGALWAAGSLVCAKYGNPGAEKQLELIGGKLANYLSEQGVTIPKTPDTKWLAKENGIASHIESFLYKYPSQILNGVYALGGAMVAKGGWKKGVRSDIASGALIIAGGLAGILIPEKAPDPEHPPQTAFAKTMSWLQEKPLRISSGFYHANNIFTVLGAFEKENANPSGKSHYLRFVTAASFIFVNTMLALSSKGHAGGSNSQQTEVMEGLAKAAAQVIAAQPKEVQETLLERISGFLATQPQAAMKAEEISALLHRELAKTAALPTTGAWQQRQQSAPIHTPSL